MRNALWWMMGSVGDGTWTQIGVLAVYVGAGGLALILLGTQIDVLALGEDAAALPQPSHEEVILGHTSPDRSGGRRGVIRQVPPLDATSAS